jgi:hypothetical protein
LEWFLSFSLFEKERNKLFNLQKEKVTFDESKSNKRDISNICSSVQYRKKRFAFPVPARRTIFGDFDLVWFFGEGKSQT